MQKIANSVTGRTVLPSVGSGNFLAFSNLSQTVFAEATIALTTTAYAAWQAANLTARPVSLVPIMGDDAIPKLLVEYTTETVSYPTNSVISNVTISSSDATSLAAAFQAWKTTYPFYKIIRATQMTGLDGEVAIFVEYGTSSTITTLANSQISQQLFEDTGGVNASYALYSTWRSTAANASLKPYRLTYIIAGDGTCGILVEYTNFGSSPSNGQIRLSFIADDALEHGAPGFLANLQGNKTDWPTSRIYRITPVFQGLLIESVLDGPQPLNYLVSQTGYNATTVTTATDAYQVFKTANPTLIPIRLTAMTWGDGTTSIIAETITG